MSFVRVPKDLFYYVGEKPPSLPCDYVNKNNVIITDAFDGATLVALCKIDAATEFSVPCTNPATGSFTIDFATGANPSSFAAAGSMRIDVKVTDGGTHEWHLPRFSFEIRPRT